MWNFFTSCIHVRHTVLKVRILFIYRRHLITTYEVKWFVYQCQQILEEMTLEQNLSSSFNTRSTQSVTSNFRQVLPVPTEASAHARQATPISSTWSLSSARPYQSHLMNGCSMWQIRLLNMNFVVVYINLFSCDIVYVHVYHLLDVYWSFAGFEIMVIQVLIKYLKIRIIWYNSHHPIKIIWWKNTFWLVHSDRRSNLNP